MSGIDERTGALEDELGVRCVVHEVVDSTMNAAAADPGPRPVLHVAGRQRAGRGRRGRRWESPAGNLYATLAWLDPDQAIPPGVLGAIQVAWAEAVTAAGGPRCRVEWPNDGIVDGGKWSGVLAERGPGPSGTELRLGLGANLTAAPRIDGARPAVALLPRWSDAPSPDEAARLLLRAAIAVVQEGSEAIVERLRRWSGHDALEPGDPVAIRGRSELYHGRYVGIDPAGRLRLEIDGEVRTFAVGEVDRLRRS